MGVIIAILWVLFVLSAVLLCAIILLQEGKGGGLAEAFGGMGAEAFGVKAGGVTKVTAVLAAVFLGSAILVASLHKQPVFQPAAPLPGIPATTPGETSGTESAGPEMPPAGGQGSGGTSGGAPADNR
ncbi:MAG: preprotein translocase subunit SecG [Planctomycetota bacterium]